VCVPRLQSRGGGPTTKVGALLQVALQPVRHPEFAGRQLPELRPPRGGRQRAVARRRQAAGRKNDLHGRERREVGAQACPQVAVLPTSGQAHHVSQIRFNAQFWVDWYSC